MKNLQGSSIYWATGLPVSVEDCACSTSNRDAFLITDLSPHLWQAAPDISKHMLPQNCTLLFNPQGPVGITVLDQPALSVFKGFRHPTPLENDTARQLAQLGLLQPANAPALCPTITPTILTAWLHVTNACNLRCTYCYINKSDEYMTETTGLAAVEAVFKTARRNNFKTVKLKYAGGEATLNFNLIQTLHHHARRLADNTGIKLQEVVLSNGVGLTGTMLNFMQTEQISLMISLDGFGAAHDTQRMFINNAGSSRQVLLGIERALNAGIQPHLSITVTGNNADKLSGVVEFALEHDLPFNLNFYRDNDYLLSKTDLQAEDQRLIEGVLTAFAVIEQNLPQHSLIGTLVDRANFGGMHTHPCGVGQNYLVIDHAGNIARCQMDIENPVSSIYADNPLDRVKNYELGFQNVSVDEKEGCKTCQWRYWCAGGCPLLAHRVTGHSDVKSPYCNVYQAVFPELLRLEGLRLLEWTTPH